MQTSQIRNCAIAYKSRRTKDKEELDSDSDSDDDDEIDYYDEVAMDCIEEANGVDVMGEVEDDANDEIEDGIENGEDTEVKLRPPESRVIRNNHKTGEMNFVLPVVEEGEQTFVLVEEVERYGFFLNFVKVN